MAFVAEISYRNPLNQSALFQGCEFRQRKRIESPRCAFRRRLHAELNIHQSLKTYATAMFMTMANLPFFETLRLVQITTKTWKNFILGSVQA